MAVHNNTINISSVKVSKASLNAGNNKYQLIAFYIASAGTRAQVQDFAFKINIPEGLTLVKAQFPNTYRRYFVPHVDPVTHEYVSTNLIPDAMQTEDFVNGQLFVSRAAAAPSFGDGFIGDICVRIPDDAQSGDEYTISIDTDADFIFSTDATNNTADAAESAYTRTHIYGGKIRIVD
jgi:hypothetical protein